MKNTYNGWKNKETWLVNLYMNNHYETYSWMNEVISTHIDKCGGIEFSKSEELLWEMMEVLKDTITEILFCDNSHLPNAINHNASEILREDLLNTALWKVDWLRLTEHQMAEWIEANETHPTK